ncbi:MAG: hypothetical protein OEY49_14565 [Candidatus Heimdallarchaeota archaeon]|nr:hypothetical protein [Candidatus Heimdallarchaeota archaeon]
MNNMHGFWNYWYFGLIILLLLAVIVANDAMRFGENGALWAFVTIIMPMFGIFLYIVIRSTWTIGSNNRQSHYSGYNLKDHQQEIREGELKTNQTTSEYQYCTSCGFKNAGQASFCNNCGFKILNYTN